LRSRYGTKILWEIGSDVAGTLSIGKATFIPEIAGASGMDYGNDCVRYCASTSAFRVRNETRVNSASCTGYKVQSGTNINEHAV
jgi:hypothetical protein